MKSNRIWTDFDRAFFGPFHRRGLTELLRDFDRATTARRESSDDGFALQDNGDDLELLALLPGVAEDAIELSVQHDVLTLAAKREVAHGDDLRAHRSERRPWTLQRTFSLPVHVDPERTKAVLRDGVLRVTMAKAETEKPRKIAVTAA